jgi:molybdopterin molybdotransferase
MISDLSPKLLSVIDAQNKIIPNFSKLNLKKISLLNSNDYILAEDIRAPFDLPEKDNSAMDGFAIKYKDIIDKKITELEVIGRVGAENKSETSLNEGQAIRIMTGGEIPLGADSVVPFENTDSGPIRGLDYPNKVNINTPVNLGDNIREAGLDFKKNDLVLNSGKLIRSHNIGLLAAFGINEVPVIRKPVISVISTGNEVVMPGDERKPGQIYDSNSFMISSAIKEAGGEVNLLNIVGDRKEDIESAVLSCSKSDLIISIGGVSKGDFDLIKDVLIEKGEINFWGINMKPGKPLAFGNLNLEGNNVFQIGLPGNPVSAYVCFELFIRPVILKMRGLKNLMRGIVKAKISEDIFNNDGRRAYARVKLIKNGNDFIAKVYQNQNSNILSSLAYSNGLAICPEDCKVIKSGEEIEVMLLRG